MADVLTQAVSGQRTEHTIIFPQRRIGADGGDWPSLVDVSGIPIVYHAVCTCGTWQAPFETSDYKLVQAEASLHIRRIREEIAADANGKAGTHL